MRNVFFSTQLQCCLNFSRIELQMLLRCSLVHHYPETHFIFKIFVTMSRPMSRSIYFVLCDLYFIFSLIFIVIIHITSSKQTHLFFFTFSRNIAIIIFNKILLDDSVDEEREYFSISKSSALGCFLAFAWFCVNCSLVFAYKSVAHEKADTLLNNCCRTPLCA